MRLHSACLAALAVLLACGPVHGRSWTVGHSGTEDFDRLYSACAVAASGDSILIAPGTYDESDSLIALNGKPLSIIGTGARPEDVGVRLWMGQTSCPGSLVENICIRNSLRPLNAYTGDITIRRCYIVNNNGTAASGALNLTSLAIVEDCVFESNGHSPRVSENGALRVGSGSTVRRCVFINNAAIERAGAMSVSFDVVVEDCLFVGNSAGDGAAITLSGGSLTVRRCTFWGNRPTGWMGSTVENPGMTGEFSHCIIGGTIGGYGVGGTFWLMARCCDFWQNERGNFAYQDYIDEHLGSFEADPLFCGSDSGDYRLSIGSPCLPGEHDGIQCDRIGAYDLGCDITPTRKTSWGRLKAFYR